MIKTEAALKLIFKLTFWYSGVFVVTAYGMFLFFDYQLDDALKKKQHKIIDQYLSQYIERFEDGGVEAVKLHHEKMLEEGIHSFSVRVIKPGMKPFFSSFPVEETSQKLEKILDKEIFNPKRHVKHIRSYFKPSPWFIVSIPLDDEYVLQFGNHAPQESDFQRDLEKDFVFAIFPFLVLSILGGAWLTHRSIQPVDQLGKTIQQILATGKLDQRVPIRHKREDLNEIIKLFNQLLEKNQTLIEGMRYSLDSVAHDIRTPMTRLRASAEQALQGPGDISPKEALMDCLEESDDILKMLNVLMEVAEAESGILALNYEQVSLSELIDKVVDLYEICAEEKKIQISTQVPAKLRVEADGVRLQQVVVNLLDNAIKYIGEGNKIEIQCSKEGNWVLISIEDDGIGISPEDQKKIWDRLYRGDSSRSQRGLGIGLSLVRAIVTAHAGKIKLESILNQGTKFTLRLPLMREHSLSRQSSQSLNT